MGAVCSRGYQPAPEGTELPPPTGLGTDIRGSLRRKANHEGPWIKPATEIGAITIIALALFLGFGITALLARSNKATEGQPAAAQATMPRCSEPTQCPESVKAGGGYYCKSSQVCRRAADGPFEACPEQCLLEAAAAPTGRRLAEAGFFDLRVVKDGRLVGCTSPSQLFPGEEKYGCQGRFAKPDSCDSASFSVKRTRYVAAVHQGCDSEGGHGAYAYAFDDGVGLRQCPSVSRYEWVFCPTGGEAKPQWHAEADGDRTRRFRVTNKCDRTVWVQQAGASFPEEEPARSLAPGESYTYWVPNRGLPSVRLISKVGCDSNGNNCDVQSMPPCPAQGCDRPVDTKLEASFGCLHARGDPLDALQCTLTPQGKPCTYQDWWDGSAVDGWTLPFSVLVNDDGHSLEQSGHAGSSPHCRDVVCSKLDAAALCPEHEFLAPEV